MDFEHILSSQKIFCGGREALSLEDCGCEQKTCMTSIGRRDVLQLVF